MTKDSKTGKSKTWRPQTMMVRGGTTRSQYGETSEALYLNSGFVYDSPEQQSARMAGDEPLSHNQSRRACFGLQNILRDDL